MVVLLGIYQGLPFFWQAVVVVIAITLCCMLNEGWRKLLWTLRKRSPGIGVKLWGLPPVRFLGTIPMALLSLYLAPRSAKLFIIAMGVIIIFMCLFTANSKVTQEAMDEHKRTGEW